MAPSPSLAHLLRPAVLGGLAERPCSKVLLSNTPISAVADESACGDGHEGGEPHNAEHFVGMTPIPRHDDHAHPRQVVPQPDGAVLHIMALLRNVQPYPLPRIGQWRCAK